jgi:L-arabinose isomerase
MNGWLKAGGTHHMVMTMGLHAGHWAVFAELAELELVTV